MLMANLVFVTIVMIYCIFQINKQKHSFTNSMIHTHIIIMAISVISSVTYGLIIGLLFGHDLVTSTIIACSTGLIIGFIAGKPFDMFVILSGMIEGIMGGMMGAMTGMMLHHSSTSTHLLLFVDSLFLLFTLAILATLTRKAPKFILNVFNK